MRINEITKVIDRHTGEEYYPKQKEDELMWNNPKFKAQMTRMGKEQGKGWPKRKVEEELQDEIVSVRRKGTNVEVKRQSGAVQMVNGDPTDIKTSTVDSAGEIHDTPETIPQHDMPEKDLGKVEARLKAKMDADKLQTPAQKQADAQAAKQAETNPGI